MGFTVLETELSWVHQFGDSACTQSRPWYVALRGLLAAVMLVGFGLELSHDLKAGVGPWYPIYLTNWVLFLENCYLVLTTYIALSIAITSPELSSHQPWYTKLAWLLRCIAQPGALVVTVALWTLLRDNAGAPSTILVHAINSVVVCLDVLASRYPIRLAHFIYVLATGTVYVAWSGIHYVANLGVGTTPDHRYIYSMLDWSAGNQAQVRRHPPARPGPARPRTRAPHRPSGGRSQGARRLLRQCWPACCQQPPASAATSAPRPARSCIAGARPPASPIPSPQCPVRGPPHSLLPFTSTRHGQGGAASYSNPPPPSRVPAGETGGTSPGHPSRSVAMVARVCVWGGAAPGGDQGAPPPTHQGALERERGGVGGARGRPGRSAL